MDLRRGRYARQMVEPASGPDAAGRFLPHRSARRHGHVGSPVPYRSRGSVPGSGHTWALHHDPIGPIVLLKLPEQNLGRIIQEGWDYELAYSFETSRLGHGDWGTLTATLNGTYIDRVVLQAVVGGPEQSVVGKFGGGFLGSRAVVRLRIIAGTRACSMTDRGAHGWLDSIPALSCTTSASIGIIKDFTRDGRVARSVNGLPWTGS